MRISSMAMVCRVVATVVIFLQLASGCKKHDVPNEKDREVDIKLVADNFVSPIGLVAPDDNSKRMFVIDQVGKIWVIDKNGNKLSTPFLDLTSKLVTLTPAYDERGLLGLAFHPGFRENGKFYVYYQMPPRTGGPATGVLWDNLSRISEFKVSGNVNVADMSSERVVLEWDDPQSNHNGGTLAFGPDSYLYISLGDGGAANDVAPGHVEDWYAANAGGNAQNVEANLFGKILRINVNGTPYSIPSDNPFVNKAGMDEIYAYGFRNPFRMAFDMGGTHMLVAGDAGQVLWEEISVVKKGGNYGWNVKEGTHCFNAANNTMVMASCPMVDNLGNNLIDPVIELNNWANPAGGIATTVIGGNFYRGKDIKGWDGKYIFGTFSQTPTTANGELFVASPSSSDRWSYEEVMLKSHPDDVGYYLRGFGNDDDGEVYLTVSSMLGPSGNTGKVFKLVTVKNKWDY
ncbi:PQQ-dependent sugar dehydrogenase [Niastella sp. OAS944]|uniref:PQQ-dependent sugar dehydrogenase n=1 Tax=Niastella sp. OAS944 TaxID=2664089 RepID=UPI00347D07F8|nr:glucose/arabinose dehydrogenase [Chitinophagaceae bacterium OAS944]